MDDAEPTASDADRIADAASASATRADWSEVRRVYELGADSVPTILARFGLTPWQFRKVREGENWTTRPPIAKPGPLQGRKPIGEDANEFRLNRLVAIGIDMLERKVADEGMTEANARTLKELCRAQETRMRSTRNEKAAKAREKKNNDAGEDFRDDPNWLKAEFSRRLDLILGTAGDRSSVREAAEGGSAGDPRLAESVHHGAA